MTHPQRLRLALPLLIAAPHLLWPARAQAQDKWPSAPVRMVVPFPPGGSSDMLGRLIAEKVGALLKANIFVENKPGGTTQIGSEFVANAAPDGNTLLLASATSFTALPNLRKLNYGIDSFEIAGGREAGRKFADALTLHSHVANIGDVRSLVIHPASTTHSQLTPEEQVASAVSPGLIRLSVGLETVDDILADLDQGFAAAK